MTGRRREPASAPALAAVAQGWSPRPGLCLLLRVPHSGAPTDSHRLWPKLIRAADHPGASLHLGQSANHLMLLWPPLLPYHLGPSLADLLARFQPNWNRRLDRPPWTNHGPSAPPTCPHLPPSYLHYSNQIELPSPAAAPRPLHSLPQASGGALQQHPTTSSSSCHLASPLD